MSRLAKIMARELVLRVPYVRDRYLNWEFLRREQSFRGVYSTFTEALAAIPAGRLKGYDHPEIADFYADRVDELNPADYPVLFWISTLLPVVRSVFDLGGNLGLAYYAYRRYLAFPAQLRWTVCEVPETVTAGRKLAEERGEAQLSFTDDPDSAGEVDLYITSGTLQYIEEPFAAMLARLSTKPRHVIVNRVPLYGEKGFVTLQNNGAWLVPYKVANEAEFIDSMAALGYELIDRWQTPRNLQILMHPLSKVANYQGLYFRLANRDTKAG